MMSVAMTVLSFNFEGGNEKQLLWVLTLRFVHAGWSAWWSAFWEGRGVI